MVWDRHRNAERRRSSWRNDELFKLNVGGKSFCFRPDTVLDHREPNSLLARLVRLDHQKRLLLTDGFLTGSGEYYMERNVRVAEHVLDYFLTGKLHKPPDICPQRFSEELLFWKLTRVELAPCCSVLTDTQQKLKQSLETERQLDQVGCCRELRKMIWHVMESPTSSLISKLFTLISVFFILASVIGLVLGSMPEFQEDARFADQYHALLGARKTWQHGNQGAEEAQQQQQQMDAWAAAHQQQQQQQEYATTRNGSTSTSTRRLATAEIATTTQQMPTTTVVVEERNHWRRGRNRTTTTAATTTTTSTTTVPPIKFGASENTTTRFIYRPTDNPVHWLVTLEHCCIAWFTLEFMVRLLVAPRRLFFLRQPMNLIDVFTVLPFFCELALNWLGIDEADHRLRDFAGAMLVMRVLRVLRMARVFKLARYSTGLQVFGTTLRNSLRELCMLSMFLLCGTIFFSTLMYYAEKDEPNSDFRSIPAACWWCIITVTTVGYGDCLISSWVGKLVAALSSVFGIIILAFPISMVVENFAIAQQKSKLENQLREVQMAHVANDYLIRRYPSRRKACREPLGIGGGGGRPCGNGAGGGADGGGGGSGGDGRPMLPGSSPYSALNELVDLG